MRSISIIMIFIFSIPSLALPEFDQLSAIRRSIKQETSNIIHNIDPKASIYVKLTPVTTEISLPGTPFNLEDLTLKNPEGAIILKEVNIKVFTRQDDIPKDFTNYIEQYVFDAYGVKPTIEISKFDNALNWSRLVIFDVLTKPESFITAFLTLIIVIFSLVFVLFYRTSKTEFNRTLIKGIDKISESLESSPDTPYLDKDENNKRATITSDEMDFDKDLIANLPNEGLLNLIADCYWSEKDSYAAYVWKFIGIEKRKYILEQSTWLKEYLKYLAEVAPEPGGYHQDPYYLSPLPLWHLNNDELVKEVKKNKDLFYQLPQCRTDNMLISAMEKIGLLKSKSISSSVHLADFKNKKASQPRKLKISIKLNIQSIDEERKLLDGGLSFEIMESIPSLGWLSTLSNEKIEAILKNFSAAELASAWIGPEEVLDKLKTCIAEKKFKLLNSYLEKITPNRSSRVFFLLHKSSIEELKNMHHESFSNDAKKVA